MMKEQFIKRGATVLEAGNGEDALKIIESERVDAVISDVRMPRKSGIELLEEIRKRPAKSSADHCVVAVVTGFADLPLEDFYAKGADMIFGKPFDPRVLVESVIHALDPPETRWRRKWERLDTEVEVEVELGNYMEGVSTRTLNIGRGGMFLAMRQAFPKIGEIVEFCIQTEDHDLPPVRGKAICRWVREQDLPEMPSGVGLEFVDLSPEAVKTIGDLLDRLKSTAFIPKT